MGTRVAHSLIWEECGELEREGLVSPMNEIGVVKCAVPQHLAVK